MVYVIRHCPRQAVLADLATPVLTHRVKGTAEPRSAILPLENTHKVDGTIGRTAADVKSEGGDRGSKLRTPFTLHSLASNVVSSFICVNLELGTRGTARRRREADGQGLQTILVPGHRPNARSFRISTSRQDYALTSLLGELEYPRHYVTVSAAITSAVLHWINRNRTYRNTVDRSVERRAETETLTIGEIYLEKSSVGCTTVINPTEAATSAIPPVSPGVLRAPRGSLVSPGLRMRGGYTYNDVPGKSGQEPAPGTLGCPIET